MPFVLACFVLFALLLQSTDSDRTFPKHEQKHAKHFSTFEFKWIHLVLSKTKSQSSCQIVYMLREDAFCCPFIWQQFHIT